MESKILQQMGRQIKNHKIDKYFKKLEERLRENEIHYSAKDYVKGVSKLSKEESFKRSKRFLLNVIKENNKMENFMPTFLITRDNNMAPFFPSFSEDKTYIETTSYLDREWAIIKSVLKDKETHSVISLENPNTLSEVYIVAHVSEKGYSCRLVNRDKDLLTEEVKINITNGREACEVKIDGDGKKKYSYIQTGKERCEHRLRSFNKALGIFHTASLNFSESFNKEKCQ